MKEEFLKTGFCSIASFVPLNEVSLLESFYDILLRDVKRTHGLRHDLSGGSRKVGSEKIVQIMNPGR